MMLPVVCKFSQYIVPAIVRNIFLITVIQRYGRPRLVIIRSSHKIRPLCALHIALRPMTCFTVTTFFRYSKL